MTKKQNTEFGMVVTFVLLVVSLWFKIDCYVFATIALLVSMLFPVLYTPFAWVWFRLAKLLELVMSKVTLFLVFFLVVTPVGLARRLAGKDNLRLKNDQKSMLVDRTHLYEAADLEKQF